MNSSKTQFIEISKDQADRRIDNFLLTILHIVPKSHIYRLLRSGNIRVNKKRVRPDYRIQTGDILRIPPLEIRARKRFDQFPSSLTKKVVDRVLYEDDNLLIVNKLSGLAVHGGSGVDFGLIQILRAVRSDVHFMELAHRLDRETSGCLIIAKKHRILRELHQLFQDGQIEKVYYALTLGHWPRKVSRIEVPLRKNVMQSGERMVKVDTAGKKALTEFRVRKMFEEATFVEAKLKTGRTHQVRVHAQYAGHPVAGDEKYGDRAFNKKMRQKGLHRLFLHAYQVSFVLPSIGKSILVKAPLDRDLQKILVNLT
jgi:23S rRNA pseudouridine955/2504/2580 synthase